MVNLASESRCESHFILNRMFAQSFPTMKSQEQVEAHGTGECERGSAAPRCGAPAKQRKGEPVSGFTSPLERIYKFRRVVIPVWGRTAAQRPPCRRQVHGPAAQREPLCGLWPFQLSERLPSTHSGSSPSSLSRRRWEGRFPNKPSAQPVL